MMMEVRSDFTVTMKVKGADGVVRTIAKHHAEVVEMEGESEASSPVPHLHRLSPDGKWLASYDADDGVMHLSSTTGLPARSFKLADMADMAGRVRQFRWVGGDASFVISDHARVFVAGIPSGALADATPAELAEAEVSEVFGFRQDVYPQVLDLRRAKGGFFVRMTEDGDGHWGRQQVYYARVADGTVQELNALVPEGLAAEAAIVGGDDQLVVSMAMWNEDRFTKASDPMLGKRAELWAFDLREDGAPEFADRMACPDDYCNMTNWAPASQPLVAVHSWDKIISWDDAGEPTVHEFDPDAWRIDSLWAWPEGGWVAADQKRVRSFDDEGTTLWSWEAPGDDEIHGVHLAEGGQTALVAVGKSVYKIQNGRAKRVLRTRGRFGKPAGQAKIWGDSQTSFVDQVIELPDGSLAYTVVDLEQSFEEPSWDEPDLEALEEMAGPVAEQVEG